jgi:ribosome recycling factor
MTPEQVLQEVTVKFGKVHNHFLDELKKIRTGRAHPGMLDSVVVMAYGTTMPLNQVSTITAPDATLLQITPFDPSNLQAIASAIRDNPSLGLNPSDDGRVVRVPIPALTEERRREIVKQLSGKVEECMVAMRGVRHEALGTLGDAKRDKDISEDDYKRYAARVEELIAKQKQAVDTAAKDKEKEIMTV